jgi:hypothetical protein
MATLIYSNLFSTANPGRPLQSRPYNATEAIDGDNAVGVLTTTLLNDAAGVIELIPVPIGKQLYAVQLTWGRGDTSGSPTLATNLLLRVTDKSGNNVDQLVYAPVLSAAQATTLHIMVPLLPAAQATSSTLGSVQVGAGLAAGPAQSFGRLVLQNTAAAATAAQVNFTIAAQWK